MSPRSHRPEDIVEAFLAARRSGIGARTFVARHPELDSAVIEALESLEALECVRAAGASSPLPERVGHFRILREIGRGGMGVVAEAVEEPLGRRVALKLLPPELVVSKAARVRFQREAELAARLDHSGICTVYGAGVLEGRPWIAMRCVEGQTLGKRIAAARAQERGPLKLPHAREIDPARAVAACIARVARSLAAAHAQGVLHRDVKPSNVMVTPSGEAVLLDFGLAIEPESDAASLTRTGDIAGTPAYLAPELVAGEIERSDAQCDVYALGVTLYECLALEAPFRGPTRAALYRAVTAGGAADVRRFNPAVPRDLAVVVATALERDRAARYASAEHFALDLEAVVEHRPIAARPIGPLGRLVRWARREPRQALLAAALAVTALVLAVIGGVLIDSRVKVQAGEIAQRAQTLEDSIFAAYLELASSHREDADAAFTRVLALDPDNYEALAGRAFTLVRMKRNAEALELLRDAPRSPAFDGLRAMASNEPPSLEDPAWLSGASAEELFIDGERLRLEGERRPPSEQAAWMRKALSRFEEALFRAPRARALYHQLRAWAAVGAGDEQATRSAANALVRLWPDSEGALYFAGSALTDVDPHAALPYLLRASELRTDRAATFQCLGVVRMRLGELAEARAAFERALELKPTDATAYNGLACVFEAMGCDDDERVALESALALDPRQAPALSNLAGLELRQGDLAALAHTLERLLEADPGLAMHRGLYAWVLQTIGERHDACDQMAIAVASLPHDASMWREYARHLLAVGEVTDAQEALDIARSLDPDLEGLAELESEAEQMLAHD